MKALSLWNLPALFVDFTATSGASPAAPDELLDGCGLSEPGKFRATFRASGVAEHDAVDHEREPPQDHGEREGMDEVMLEGKGEAVAARIDRARRAVTFSGGLCSCRLFVRREHPLRPSEGEALVLKGADYGASQSRLVGSILRGAAHLERGLPSFVLSSLADYTRRDRIIVGRSDRKSAPGISLAYPKE